MSSWGLFVTTNCSNPNCREQVPAFSKENKTCDACRERQREVNKRFYWKDPVRRAQLLKINRERAHTKRQDPEFRATYNARKAAWSKMRSDTDPEFKAKLRLASKRHREKIGSVQVRSKHFKHRYGITIEQRDEMVLAQNYLCAACGKDVRTTMRGPMVDHCHRTNKLREILCAHCNTALGYVRDDVDVLRSLIAYLERHQS